MFTALSIDEAPPRRARASHEAEPA